MSNINIIRAVENIRSGTTVYTPVIELIVNAIQAIRAVEADGGTIEVVVVRSGQVDMIDKVASIDGFIVSDDGIGFNQVHRDSFDTLYTAQKAADGGKGFGRFTCLKYFNRYHVESVFDDGAGPRRRTFSMGTGNNIIIDEIVVDAKDAKRGTIVRLSEIKSVKIPDKGLDVVARILVEKLLPYFIDANFECPKIYLSDPSDGAVIVLNDYLTQQNRQIVELPLSTDKIVISSLGEDVVFAVRVFKFFFPRMSKSKISLVAHRREVTDVTIQTYIPEFADEFYQKGSEGERDRNYIIKAYVLGDYLDNNVSLERGGFNFPKEGDLSGAVSQIQIEEAASDIAQSAVGDEISARRDRKKDRIRQYIRDDAPWHQELSDTVDFSTLNMNPKPEEIELHLQTAKYKMEVRTRAEVQRLLADSTGELTDRVSELVDSISQSSKNDLIHYVSMRKCVLDIFGKALEIGADGKYRTEGDVHDIIVLRRKDSETLKYDDHNLWILDERLNFCEFISSDKPLDGKKGPRADIAIFGRRVAFRGENDPSNPITIFEFKRPQREDFVNPSSEEDPVQQIVRYVNDIRDGKYKTPLGRDILVADSTPFYGYVVCDLTAKVKEWLVREKNFIIMPDGLGYFQWFGNIKLYIEVLSWTKVERDAKMRNKIFFHKLGIT